MSNYNVLGGKHWSYQTVIREGDIGNITKYSVTTSRHQKKAGVHQCAIKLDNVPINCTSLVHLAQARGLIDER